MLIFKRTLGAIPVLWVVATLTFVMMHFVPGGPFDTDKAMPPEIVANLKAKYHLDRPLLEQYVLYIKRLCHGDLGISYKYTNRTVNEIIACAFPVSLQLGSCSLLLAILMGIPLGVCAALKQGSKYDTLFITLATLGISVPTFVTGALLIFIFGIWLKILPVALWEGANHIFLPSLTLSASPAAYLARLARASTLEVLTRDYVKTAHLKGLGYWHTIIFHVLRNALIPIITVLGPLTAILITGSFVVEYIYAIPGMGRFFVTAVSNRDYDLIMGTTLIFSLILIITNTCVDIAYMFLDPRIKVEG